MVEKRRGLGRGLGALISGSPSNEEENAPQFASAPVAALDSDPATPSPTQRVRDTAQAESKPSSFTDAETSDNQKMEAATASAVSRETSSENTSETLPERQSVGEKKRKSTESSGKENKAKTASLDDSTAQQAVVKQDAETPSGATQIPRKSRPVDMFFTPGRAESNEEARITSESTSERKNSANKNRRVAVPDVLGRVRGPRDVTTEAGSSIPVEEKPTPPEDFPLTDTGDWEGSQDDGPENRISESVSRETLVAVPGATFAEVAVGSIHPNRKQPRNVFDDDDMAELVHSIREVGLLQPIVLRPSDEGGDQHYELVMGERRWRAVQEAGLATIPAIVRETSDTALLRDALLENLHRSQLNPLEEAAAYQQLMQEFDCTQDELSERIGRSRPQISNTIRLMKLPALVQRRVAAGVLSAGHARALLGLEDVADMERVAQRIVNEGLSVRATEEIVSMNDGLRRTTKEKAPRATARHERLDYLANSLSDHLETNVKISLGAKKGRVSIEFGSVDDLNRIMGVIAPSAEQ